MQISHECCGPQHLCENRGWKIHTDLPLISWSVTILQVRKIIINTSWLGWCYCVTILLVLLCYSWTAFSNDVRFLFPFQVITSFVIVFSVTAISGQSLPDPIVCLIGVRTEGMQFSHKCCGPQHLCENRRWKIHTHLPLISWSVTFVQVRKMKIKSFPIIILASKEY